MPFRALLLVVFGLLSSVGLAAAQTAAETTPSTPPPASALEAMEDAQPGDHWTYEVRDEITGDLKSTLIQTVTDVSATEIGIRVTVLGNPGNGFLTFDRGWSLKNNGTWRYSPSDGTGISGPLSVGKTWPVKSTDTNTSASTSFKRSGTSKVAGKESVTTKAGTFDSYKIEMSFQGLNTKDPTRKVQMVQTTWYAPEVDHWVKRISETRIDGRVHDKSSMELIEYGRR
jgi:hypothetical protein